MNQNPILHGNINKYHIKTNLKQASHWLNVSKQILKVELFFVFLSDFENCIIYHQQLLIKN